MITQFAKLLLVSHCYKWQTRTKRSAVQSPWLAVGVSLMADWSGGGWEVGAILYLIIRVEDDLRRGELRGATNTNMSPGQVMLSSVLLLAASPLTWCWVCGVKCGVNPNPTINSLLSTILHLFSTTTAMAALSLTTATAKVSPFLWRITIHKIFFWIWL